ncbi:glutaconate CoA-transferase [Desulfosporosinus burensis]
MPKQMDNVNNDENSFLNTDDQAASDYTHVELLAVATAREINDGDFAFVGTGLPLLAAGLAQHTKAPNMTIILEAGTVGPSIKHLPVSVADPRAGYMATILSTTADAFGTIASRGYCSLGVLGAAECDKYGNLNSTAIGGYWPNGVESGTKGSRTRLTGSGGANSIANLADKVIVMMVHEKRRFPEKVEYLTSPAGARGPKGEGRLDYGIFRGGEMVVISDLGILRPNPESGILELEQYYPGVDPQFVQENTGWPLVINNAREMASPTIKEINILRTYVDPERLYLGRKSKRS